MSRPRIRDAELRDLDTLWRELKTMEADYGALTSILAQPTGRPGVFAFRLEFTPLVGNAAEVVGRQALVIEFPGPASQTLAGALWSASAKLARQVADAYHEARAARKL